MRILLSKRFVFVGTATVVLGVTIVGVYGTYLCTRPTTADEYYRRGVLRLDNRDYRGAASDLSAALSLTPSWDTDNRAATSGCAGAAELQGGTPGDDGR